MKRLLPIFLSAILISFAVPAAHATEGFSNGYDLKDWCDNMETDDLKWGLCVGSITAAHDVVMTYQQAGSGLNKVVCAPKGVIRHDALNAVVKYMASHPDELKYSLGDLVVSALADAFPCP